MRGTEQQINKNQVISELSRSPHGKLEEYCGLGAKAAKQEPDFFAHLIAWDRVKGQIRDSKVALPVLALGGTDDPELIENALAHIASLGPRELLRAVRFAMGQKIARNAIRRLVTAYLREREENHSKWSRMAVQHRGTLRELYALLHIKPAPIVDAILFKGERPKGSIFEAVASLRNMSSTEAAGTIMEMRIPFLIAKGALGEKMKNPDLLLALIGRMSPAELVTNTAELNRLGLQTVPALRAAYEEALGKAAKSKKGTLKTTRAAEAIEDEAIKAKLQDLQEKQIKNLGGVDGNWLVIGDKSGSMRVAIEVARAVAATLAKMVKGKVHLVFVDESPYYNDVTGLTYEQIKEKTKRVGAGGGTNIGCGLLSILEKHIDVDGIAIVSDGGENRAPWFCHVYKQYCQGIGKEIPVYLYRTDGDSDSFSERMRQSDLDVQRFDLTGTVDYYALPNLVQTMRVQRYSLIDEIMETPLLRLEGVLEKYSETARKKGELANA